MEAAPSAASWCGWISRSASWIYRVDTRARAAASRSQTSSARRQDGSRSRGASTTPPGCRPSSYPGIPRCHDSARYARGIQRCREGRRPYGHRARGPLRSQHLASRNCLTPRWNTRRNRWRRRGLLLLCPGHYGQQEQRRGRHHTNTISEARRYSQSAHNTRTERTIDATASFIARYEGKADAADRGHHLGENRGTIGGNGYLARNPLRCQKAGSGKQDPPTGICISRGSS
jgi:hypothetical protein